MNYVEYKQTFGNEDDYNRTVIHLDFIRLRFKCHWNHCKRNGLVIVLAPKKGLTRWLRRNGKDLTQFGFQMGSEAATSK